MSRVKAIFSLAYLLILMVVLLLSVIHLYQNQGYNWGSPLVMCAVALGNRWWHLDNRNGVHHKVKYPLASLVMFLCLGGILLTAEGPGLLLHLTLLVAGGFLLNTYWAEESPLSVVGSRQGRSS